MKLCKGLFFCQITLFAATLVLFVQVAFYANKQLTQQKLVKYSDNNNNQPKQDKKFDEDEVYPYDRSKILDFVSVDKLISAWKYTGKPNQNRDGVLLVKNLCLDPEIGLFIVDNKNLSGGRDMDDPPPVNLVASAPQFDAWWRPDKRYAHRLLHNNKPYNVTIAVNTTMFVIGTIWSHHYTHFFINNILPLIQLHDEFYKNDFNFWLKENRVLYVKNEPIDSMLDASILNFGAVMDPFKKFEIEGRTNVVCFPRAVIGLNNTCDLGNHCKNKLQPKNYRDLRQIMRIKCLNQQEFEIQTRLDQQLLPIPRHLAIIQRKISRFMLNTDKVSDFLKEKKISHEIIFLDYGWTMCDQVWYFGSKVGAFLTLHGNAINNQLWLPPGGLIMEVRQYQYFSDFQELIFNRLQQAVKNLSYEVIQCEDTSCALQSELENPKLILRDRSSAVNITRLEQILVKHGWIDLVQ